MTINDLFNSQREVTAAHEAAHAICYLAFDYPIHHIEIEPDCVTRSTPTPVRRPVWDLAVVSMAGMVIEGQHRKHFDLDAEIAQAVEWVEGGEDPSELGDMELFATYPGLAHSAFGVATHLLRQFAQDHVCLTEALLCSSGSMSGDDVEALALDVDRQSR